MNRKLAGVLGAVVAIAVAIWFFAFRDTGHRATPATRAAGSGSQAADPWANAKATASNKQEPPPPGMAPRWVLDVDPEGPLRLEGQVVDSEGDPVGKAVVRLSSVPPRTATTEDDGSFAFDKLVGREYGLSATAGDLVGGPIGYTLTETSDPVVIRLFAGSKLVVTVVDEGAKSIENATVKLVGISDMSAKTVADGTATLKPVLPGWVAVQVSADGFAPSTGFTQLGTGGATGQLKITLKKGFAVAGRVVDERGKPVSGARVAPSGVFDIPGSLDPVTTNAKGEFSFTTLAPGTHTLIASDGVHAPARSAPITVEDRAVTNVEIVMQAGGILAGSVVDDKGAPVAFATIRVSGEGQQMWQVQSRQVTSDKAGAFEITGLTRTKLKARAESDAAASAIAVVDLTTQSEKRDLRLVLDVKGTISGIVVDEAGAPVTEVQVNAFPDILGGSTPDALVLAGMSSATTDGGGRFTVSGLPDGSYRLRAARSSGRGQYEWGQDGTAAKTGDSNVRIVLAAPGSLVGKLVLEGGSTPPAIASVQIGMQPPATANKDGTFKLDELAPGTYDLHVRGPEFAVFTKRDVVIASNKPTDIGTLTLVRGRKLTGKVVDASGNAVAGAKVKTGDMLYSLQGVEENMEQWEEMSGMRTGTSDQDGRFTLIGIAKKETSVIADHATRGRSAAVVVPGGTEDPQPVTLTLRGYGQVVGKVTSKGKPVGGATVTASPKGGGAQIQIVQSEADGSFTLNKVGEGTNVISAMEQSQLGMSMRSTSVTVQVAANKQAKVTIDIPVGNVTLTVEVKPQAGQKVDSAQVFLFRGILVMKNAKELTDAFLGGSAQGMKFWFGAGKPLPAFEELVPGDYSVCTIPITGDLNDSKLQARLQENLNLLSVYCKQVKLAASPTAQTVVHEVPAMTPLPE